jgi:hypothetical protein
VSATVDNRLGLANELLRLADAPALAPLGFLYVRATMRDAAAALLPPDVVIARQSPAVTPSRVFETLPPDPSYREFCEWSASHYRATQAPRPTLVAMDVGQWWPFPRLCSTPGCFVEMPRPTPGRRLSGWICSGCRRFRAL